MAEATIFDVARLAGVSKSTVSRVINGSQAVTDETREKIEKAMEELRYTPSAAARTLSSKQTNVIGVIFPDSSEYFFGQLLKGIIQEADAHSMVVMQCNSYHDPEKEGRALKMLAQQRIRGLIITPTLEKYENPEYRQQVVDMLKSFNVPIVFVDRCIIGLAKDGVMFDNYQGGFLAGKTIAAARPKNVGAIVVDTALTLGRDRLRGFKDGLAVCGAEADQGNIFTSKSQMSEEEILHVSRKLLDKLVPGGAVFMSNGFVSKIFLREVNGRKLKLGEDIHCVAFDRIELLETYTDLAFQYIDRSEREMGRCAAKMLLQRIAGEAGPEKQYVISAKLHNNIQ